MQRHIPWVHVCLAVTCHLHLWQNDWDCLHATAVTWGWNRCQNKSAEKVAMGKKIPLLLLLGAMTFELWNQYCSHWAITALLHIKTMNLTFACDWMDCDLTSYSLSCKMLIKFIHQLYIALFSALQQTYCGLVTCDSEWVTYAFHRAFWISTEVVTALFITWLVPHETASTSRCMFCVHQPFTSLQCLLQFKATYIGCMCV